MATRRAVSGLQMAAAFWILAAGTARAESPPIDIRLTVGQQEIIDASDVRSYSEGIAGVADVRLTKDGLSFVVAGQRPGSTSLLVLTHEGLERNYRIEVRDPSATRPDDAPDYGPGTVGLRANVRLDVYFVRVDRNYRHQLGVAWPGQLGGGKLSAGADLLGGAVTDATVVAEQALPRLDMAEVAGWAKLMHHSALITANGAEATFAGGGELNILVAGSLAAELRQVRFGTRVKMRPRYDSDSGRIELSIDAEISDLIDDRGTGVPGRATANLQSLVNLELGQALVLAGLRSQAQRTSSSGLPGLSRVPLLGKLFGTGSAAEEAAESIVIIVPTVIDATTAPARRQVQSALRAYRDYRGRTAGTVFPASAGERGP